MLFVPFLGKFCVNFLPLNPSVSANVMQFVRTFSITCAEVVRLIVIEKVRNYGKIVFIESMFENGWWGDASAPVCTDNNVSSLRHPAGLASA